MRGRGTEPSRPASGPEWLALGATLLPLVVAVVRAATDSWMPVGDAAYFTVRSRDVLTAHHPLLGAWSSGSTIVGATVNNLGPLQLDLLAPFTRVAPYLGTAIGTATTNGAAVVVVWIVVRRMFRPATVVGVMALTSLLIASLGLSWLIDARQQQAMVLALYALWWASAAMWAGVGLAVPIGVAVASLTVQTHFTYAWPSVAALVTGVVGFAVVTRRSRRTWPAVALWSTAVAVVCWAQPVVDQLFATGNLGEVLGPARPGAAAGAGLEAGVQVVAGAAFTLPFWAPSSMRTFLLPHDGIAFGTAVAALVAWALVGVAVTVLGWRSGNVAARAVGAASVLAVGAGVVAAAAIPVSSFGLVPQNYYWVWSLAAFVSIALVAGFSSLGPVVAASRAFRPRRRRAVLVGATVLTTAVAVWPRYPVASVAADEVEARRIGAPLREQLGATLRSGLVDDVVEVDLSRAFFANDYPYVMLVELQRAGIEFRFVAGSRNLERFGASRCTEAGTFQRIVLISGPQPELRSGAVVIAEVIGITDAELAEYADLQDRFGELLRRGDVVVDPDDVDRLDGESSEELRAVLADPSLPATGLARQLDRWRRTGIVSMPDAVGAAFEQWWELEQRSFADYQTVVVEVAGTGAAVGGRC